MKKIIRTRPITSTFNLHAKDREVLTNFLNANSKILGTITNFGTFIDITEIKTSLGIKVKNKYLIIERNVSNAEAAGKDYKASPSNSSPVDAYSLPYNLPDEFPERATSDEKVILSTVKTHSCSPQQECEICDGAGKCIVCDARGYVRCGTCDGSGSKRVSSGRNKDGSTKYKNVACGRCHGSKRVSCSSCNGTKKCSSCKGSGEVVCSRCDGSSNYQTFSILSTSLKTVISERIYTDIQEVMEVVNATKNKVAFDDDLLEWESVDELLFDKRALAIKENRHFSEFSARLDNHAGLSSHQKLGRVHTTFENVPITIVDYSFEGRSYSIYIVGENNIVCFQEIPKKHLHKTGLFTQLISIFTKKKRKLAFLYIASYMFHADGAMDAQEKQLFDLLLSHVKLNQKEREMLGKELSFDEVAPHLKCVRGDLRGVVLAWQCVLQDKKIESSEVVAFDTLAKYFKVNSTDLAKLKLKAEKFGRLNSAQLLTEYFS